MPVDGEEEAIGGALEDVVQGSPLIEGLLGREHNPRWISSGILLKEEEIRQGLIIAHAKA